MLTVLVIVYAVGFAATAVATYRYLSDEALHGPGDRMLNGTVAAFAGWAWPVVVAVWLRTRRAGRP